MYYYLAASLPTVTLDAPVPIGIDEFRETCARHLSAADLAALDELLAGGSPTAAHPFVRAWYNRDTQLRCALAEQRAARLKRDAAPCLREYEGFDVALERAAADVFSQATPLDREMALDQVRWSMIEDLAGQDAFGGTAILAYALKLQTVTRWAAMDEATGRRIAEELSTIGTNAEGNRIVPRGETP